MLNVNWRLRIITLSGRYTIQPDTYSKLVAGGWIILRHR
jgi:hypothetical protein